MDFILLLIISAIILVFCLLIYLKIRTLGSTNADFAVQQLTHQIQSLSKDQSELRHLLSTQLSTQFEKSQQQGFTQQKEVAQYLTQLSDTVSRKLSEGLVTMTDQTKKELTSLSAINKERLETIQNTVEKRLDENQRKYLESFEKTKEDLSKMQQAAASMREASNDSKSSIERLNDIFGKGATKAYGTFGESMLESVLQDTIPGSYQTQFQIPKSLEKIDFCITLADEIIGIDAKFPLDKYDAYRTSTQENHDNSRKDFLLAVKTMCDDIAKKYVASKHFNQVYIYFPSDSIYLEVVNDANLAKYLRAKSVYPSSPSTILPLIALVAQYNKRVQVKDNAEMILKGLDKVEKYFYAFQDQYRQIGEKLRLAQDKYAGGERSLDNLNRTVMTLTTSQKELEFDTTITAPQDGV